MPRSNRIADYLVAALLAAIALSFSPPGLLLITGRPALTTREIAMTLALDAFLLANIGAILTRGRRRTLFFHLMAWTFPLVLLAGFEEVAGLTHLAERIAPFEDLSLLDKRGRWPAHLLSEARWAPAGPGPKLYRPWQGDGIVINELGLRTAMPSPKSPGEWRVAISGGSAVWGWRVLDADTIPADMQRRLRQTHPNITVFNFGIEGATLAAELALLRQFRDMYALDEVLFYTGGNDVVAAYLRETAAQSEMDNLRREATGFELAKAARRLSAMLDGVSPATLATLDRDLLPRMLRNNSLREGIVAADAYCRASAIRCSFVLQPMLLVRKNPVPPEDRIARTLELVFPRLDVLIGKMYRDSIAAAPRDRALDLSNFFDNATRPSFVDTVHLNEAGNRLVAEALLPLVRGTGADASTPSNPVAR